MRPQISQRDPTYATNFVGRFTDFGSMVGGCSICSHHDCKSHTGAGMSLGTGMVLVFLWKQKINTKSSTKAELAGVDDSLRYILWTRYFMQEQGYNMEPSIIHQDNMSTILLERNGRASASNQTKHIKVKYFFIVLSKERSKD